MGFVCEFPDMDCHMVDALRESLSVLEKELSDLHRVFEDRTKEFAVELKKRAQNRDGLLANIKEQNAQTKQLYEWKLALEEENRRLEDILKTADEIIMPGDCSYPDDCIGANCVLTVYCAKRHGK